MSPFAPFYIAGPTGSGKTSVALELAGRLKNAAIVNADAFQIYRGIEILSAAPSPAETEVCPHHLFGIFDVTEDCDAARFSKLFWMKNEELQKAECFPIVVGGSGLYLKAITHGLAPTPPGDPELRAKLERLTLDELVSQYENLDPDGAAQTNLKNRRYVTRNLEICLLTGEAASALKSRWEREAPEIRAVYLHRDREDVYDRINRRTLEMFSAGVVDEIRKLSHFSSTSGKAIGLQEIRQLIDGEIDEAFCIEQIQQHTRRYAKRQESWFKREPSFVKIPASPADSPASLVDRILAIHDLPVSVS